MKTGLDKRPSLSGVMPALISPHDGRERLAVAPLETPIDWLYGAGIHGSYVCGATGEGYSLRLDERKTAAQVAVDHSRGRGPVIVHVGAQSTRDAAKLASHAAPAGAAAVASIPPIGKTHPELLAAGPMLGIFLLGILTRRSVASGALCGATAGTAVVVIVASQTPWSSLYHAPIGLATTLVCGYTASVFFAPPAPHSTRGLVIGEENVRVVDAAISQPADQRRGRRGEQFHVNPKPAPATR